VLGTETHLDRDAASPSSSQQANSCPQVFLYNGGIREEQEQPAPWAAASPLALLEGFGVVGVLFKAVLRSADDPNPPSHRGPAIVWALRGPESVLEIFSSVLLILCFRSCGDGFNEGNYDLQEKNRSSCK